jgi:hypothetical protein
MRAMRCWRRPFFSKSEAKSERQPKKASVRANGGTRRRLLRRRLAEESGLGLTVGGPWCFWVEEQGAGFADQEETAANDDSCGVEVAGELDGLGYGAGGGGGDPVASAAARRSAMGVARGEWMGARMTWSKMGKRIWVISRSGLSRRQAKIRT